MINFPRSTYLVYTSYKTNGQPLNPVDCLNIGYMAGRYGVNLNGNPYESNPPLISPQGITANINNCTSSQFEANLNNAGIGFNRLA